MIVCELDPQQANAEKIERVVMAKVSFEGEHFDLLWPFDCIKIRESYSIQTISEHVSPPNRRCVKRCTWKFSKGKKCE